MKNFTAKTADFDNLTISGQAPITPSDLGTAPNQIPLNKDLGTLAYQDAVNLDDVSADMLELRAIAAEISDSAVDVFVYDTSRDSDGGKWRERTQHTSWYNEELNTATRGGRREFPAVAVIVSEANKVTIYDGDDPDLGMWMVFNAAANNWLYYTSGAKSSVMLNGKLANAASGSNQRFRTIDFISDMHLEYTHTDGRSTFGNGISERNSGSNSLNYGNVSGSGLIDRNCNDVAMTILPNAPIDEDTGLPVPTIAVATNGGVSVIKDDGSVYDISGVSVERVAFYNDNKSLIIRETGNACSYGAIPVSDNSWTSWREGFFNETTTFPCTLNQINTGLYSNGNYDLGIPSDFGLSLIKVNPSDQNISTGAYITSKYNTGWMPGDIKLATLSDTKVEKVGVDESISASLISNGENWTGASGSTPPTDWSQYGSGANDAIYSISGGELTITENGSGNYGIMYQAFDVVAGQTYTVTVRYKSSGTGFARFFIGTAPGSALVLSTQNTGSTDFITKSITFSDTNSRTLYLSFAAVGEEGASAIFDYVSITKTGELITNGTFDNGIENWIDQSTGTQSVDSSNVSAGELTLTRLNSDSEQVSQLLNLVEGKRYVLSFDVTASINDKGEIWVGTDLPLNNQALGDGTQTAKSTLETGNILGVGSYLYTFTAGSVNYLSIRVGASDTISWDNISVRLAEPDRSVNDNGLQIFGEIDKTPVAPGADLVAYSGFSADNYLMQPYNEDLDFGTGDFCVMGWFKRNSNSTYHRIWNRADSRDHHRVEFYTDTTGNEVYFYTRDDSAYTTVKGTLPLGIWTYLVGVREGGTLKIYENGVLANSTTGVARDLTSENNAVLQIGEASSFDPGATFDGSIALFRISANVPTDAQIAKIYRDEKALFQDGAQATLYGTSDSVTALAYDEKTELLHVGTSSGRSDFSGLRRINNTTTAITTSISAHNNLIAEQ